MAFGKEGVCRCAGRCARALVRTEGRTRQGRTTEKRAHTAERHRTAAVWNDQAAARRNPLDERESVASRARRAAAKKASRTGEKTVQTMKNAILIDTIKEMDETEVIILRYLIRVLQNSADGGKRISYARSAKFLGMTYPCFTKAVKRLKEKQILVQSGEKLYLGKMIVEAVATK